MTRFSTAMLFGLLLHGMAPRGGKALGDDELHWAFRPIQQVAVPEVRNAGLMQTPVDRFIQSRLETRKLGLAVRADASVLLRRLSFDLVGLPPASQQVAAFERDSSPHAVAREVERLMASPAYGERWGKMWLDAAGYADSNGYFNADTDRPFAHKYRDYVIRSWNADKPFNQFVREQLAGDEIAGYSAGGNMTPEIVELLTATHFLRNSQDGTSESDGNPDEVTIDRATVLEGTLQITMNSLLGITIQCCRCHEHKFEPIQQDEYYQLQSVFYPAFPFFHRDKWVSPRKRVGNVDSAAEIAVWEQERQKHNVELLDAFRDWVKTARPPGAIRFEDNFDGPGATLAKWSNTAPGDDAPGGKPAVNVDGDSAPAAQIRDGKLRIVESGGAGNRWLSTKTVFDWTPEKQGDWIQVTFDLIDDKAAKNGTAAARIGYYIALHDYHDNSPVRGGNVLVDGNPAGGAAIHLDYPGDDSKAAGTIGISGYTPKRNYGIRVTNVGDNQYRLQHVVDWLSEEKSVTVSGDDLPDGGFGFEFCCGRSFIVDNVVVERLASTDDKSPPDAVNGIVNYKRKREQFADEVKSLLRKAKQPNQLAWVTDLISPAPDVHLLERGLYSERGQKVQPAGLAVLTDGDSDFQVKKLPTGVKSTGRRLAFANWLTRPNSRPAALLARVIVNRIWQHHFGRGLVATPDNLGQSGAEPSHPQLLEFLAGEFIRSGWSIKAVHRLILHSHVYQQSSNRQAAEPSGTVTDPENRLLWRFPLRRLDAEQIRDAMLTTSGEFDARQFGPYIPTKTLGDGNVVVDENHAGAHRRSLYLQQRRTKMNSWLVLFDAPAMVSTCGQRNTSTVPLQSLALLNSEFSRTRAEAFARRVLAESPTDHSRRAQHAFRLAMGRDPKPAEHRASTAFLRTQSEIYVGRDHPELKTLTDFCQMLFASSAYLYVE